MGGAASKAWFRRFAARVVGRRAERGETALATVLLVLLVVTLLAGLPFARFVGVIRLSSAMEQTQMMTFATREIEEQALRTLEAYLLPRIGAHFQSAMERSAAFRNDLARGLDPLPDATHRETFFRRAFVVPHINTWLDDMGVVDDPRLNAAYAYLASFGGAVFLEVRYAGETAASPVNAPEYLLSCDLFAEGSESGGGALVRVASFPCRFSFQRPGASDALLLPGVVLHPEYP